MTTHDIDYSTDWIDYLVAGIIAEYSRDDRVIDHGNVAVDRDGRAARLSRDIIDIQIRGNRYIGFRYSENVRRQGGQLTGKHPNELRVYSVTAQYHGGVFALIPAES